MRLVDDGWRILSNPGLGAPRRHFGLKTKSMDARGRLTARGQVTSVKGLNFLSSMITTRDRPNTKDAIAGMAHHDDGAAPMKSATASTRCMMKTCTQYTPRVHAETFSRTPEYSIIRVPAPYSKLDEHTEEDATNGAK